MTARGTKVVVWSTGGVGANAIRAIARRPDLDLVGVWVHTPEKVGRDAGELAGIDPLGVTATDDADALIALAPDCVVYAASGPERGAGAAPDIAPGSTLLERDHVAGAQRARRQPAEVAAETADHGWTSAGPASVGSTLRMTKSLAVTSPPVTSAIRRCIAGRGVRSRYLHFLTA